MERKRALKPSKTAPAYSFFADPDPETDRRQQARFEATTPVVSAAVRLVDLSSHGCCLGLARSEDYRPGQFIRLGLPGENEPVRAIVRWTETDRIGAEFTRQLGAERVDAILSSVNTPMIALL